MLSRLQLAVGLCKFRRHLPCLYLRRFKKKIAKKQETNGDLVTASTREHLEKTLPGSMVSRLIRALKSGYFGSQNATVVESEIAHEDDDDANKHKTDSYLLTKLTSNSDVSKHVKMTSNRNSSLDFKSNSKPLRAAKQMSPKKVTLRKLNVYTDASGSYGAGGYCGQRWFRFKWPENIKSNQKLGMEWMELFPITVAARLFGPDWSHRQIEFHTDNLGVVAAWEGKRNNWNLHEANLMKELKAVAKQHQFDMTISHISGKYNTIADAISRGKELPPKFDEKPIDIPNDTIQDLLPFQERPAGFNPTTETFARKSHIASESTAETTKTFDLKSKQVALATVETQKVGRSLNVYTDASGKYGAGGFCGPEWFCVRWPEDMKSNKNSSMAWKAVFPITVAARLLGPGWSNLNIKFHTHDPKIVKAWHDNHTYKPPNAAKLLEEVKIAAQRHQFHVTISTISGPENNTADAISRGKDLPKELDRKPVKVPNEIIKDLLLTVRKGK